MMVEAMLYRMRVRAILGGTISLLMGNDMTLICQLKLKAHWKLCSGCVLQIF